MRLGVLVVALAFLALARYVVETPAAVEGVSVAYLGGGSARLSAGVFRPALLYSGYVPVRVVDADGARWFVARNGTLLDLRRPPVVYAGNKTRVLYFGNSLGADAVVHST